MLNPEATYTEAGRRGAPLWGDAMTHPEFFYINAGYCYERLGDPARRIARAKELRALIDAEPDTEREMVRSLIQRGRLEYRARGEK